MSELVRLFRPAPTGLLVLLLAVTLLTGCGSEPTVAATPTPLPTATPVSTPLPPDASVPARILARGYLLVGVRYDLPPFGFVTADGTLDGLDVELGHELARRWLGDAGAVRFRQVRSDTAARHLLSGDVDLVLTAMLHTQPLEEQVDFATPLFEDGHALLVRAGDAPTLTAPTTLAGLPIGLLADSDAGDALAAAVPFTPTFIAYSDLDQALAALQNGEISTLTDLRRRLAQGLERAPQTVITGQYSRAYLAPAVAPNQPDLSNLLDFTVQDLYQDGTLTTLYARWLTGLNPPAVEIWPGTARTDLRSAQPVAAAVDTLAAIRARGQLRVALVGDRSPFAYLDADGMPSGYKVQLVQLLAQRWLGDRLAVEFLPVPRAEGLQMVASGAADMLIGVIPHTREMELQVDTSLPIYTAGEGLLVADDAAPAGLAGLNGQTVAVVEGTASADTLNWLAQQAGIALTVVPKASLEEALAALQAGEVLAVAMERTEMLGLAYATPGVYVTDERLTAVPLVIALPPGDSAFRDRVNLTLQAMNWDGEFAVLYGAWFDDEPPAFPPWPGEPTYPLQITIAAP